MKKPQAEVSVRENTRQLSNCFAQLQSFKNSYLERLSQKRADILKEKFIKKNQNSPDFKIINQEEKEANKRLVTSFIKLKTDMAKELISLGSKYTKETRMPCER